MRIQRYDLDIGFEGRPFMEKDPHGDWVRYKDLPKWIPVGEAVPGNVDTVLVRFDDGSKGTAWYSQKDKDWSKFGVTHWLSVQDIPE